MYDRQELLDRLKDVLEALERIPRRSESIHSADDFLVDEAGLEHLDAEQVFTICKEDIPELIGTVRVMIKDLQEGAAF